MIVKTKYPIVVTDSTKQSDAQFRRTYSGADGAMGGGMEVITDYPIVVTDSSKQSEDEYRGTYSAVTGAERRAKRAARQAKGQGFGQKLKRGFQNLAQSGALQALIGGAAAGSAVGAMDNSSLPPADDQPKGLSKGAKIGIAVGALAIIGGAIWYFTKKK